MSFWGWYEPVCCSAYVAKASFLRLIVCLCVSKEEKEKKRQGGWKKPKNCINLLIAVLFFHINLLPFYLTTFRPVLITPTGNKSDLHAQRQVLFEDACTLAENNSMLAALETSAKEAQNVEAAFILMARELLARNGTTITDEASQNFPQFMISDSSHPVHSTMSSDKKCGCGTG